MDIDTTLGYSGEEAAGTGIVLTSNGEILTNNHVIDGATTISVTDVGNGKTYSASVVGYDKTKDVAVLQLHNASGLQTASITTSTASVGETVVGIGNAGGTGGTPSAAGGTVTALDQSITASDEGDGTSEQLTGLIETNADIQAGDSGGSLVNSAGQVIGMDTAASSGTSFQSAQESSGYQGYAIPIGEATTLAKEIEAGDSSSTVHIGTTAFLGVEIQAAGDGYGNEASNGATVAGVITDSPAQEAGLAARRHHHLGERSHGRFGANALSSLARALQAGRQGDDRLDRLLGPDAHRHGDALIRPPAISGGSPGRSLVGTRLLVDLFLGHAVDGAVAAVGGDLPVGRSLHLEERAAAGRHLLGRREVFGADASGDRILVGEAVVDGAVQAGGGDLGGVATDALERRPEHLLEHDGRPIADGHSGREIGRLPDGFEVLLRLLHGLRVVFVGREADRRRTHGRGRRPHWVGAASPPG